MPTLKNIFRNHQTRSIIAMLLLAFVLVAMIAYVSPTQKIFAQATATATLTLTPTNTPTLTPTAVSTPFAMVQGNGLVTTFTCNTGRFPTPVPGDCIQLRTGSIHAYDKDGNVVFSVDGTNGNITTAGSFTITGSSNGQKCFDTTQTFTGAATIPAATVTARGITTPQPALITFGDTPNNNRAILSSTTSGGVVTLNAWQAITGATLTPVAATTPVTVMLRECGQ